MKTVNAASVRAIPILIPKDGGTPIQATVPSNSHAKLLSKKMRLARPISDHLYREII
jgi:hypothetical protein